MNKYLLLLASLLLPMEAHAAENDATARQYQAVRDHFVTITSIPHRSGHEKAMREHVISVAKKYGLSWKVDTTGNLLVIKPASKGFESAPPVALQGHLDMVCVADRDDVDLDAMPITTVVEDGWLRADGTSLGADDGVGMAYMLTLMQFDDLAHGKLELLFTVDEEVGMMGAANLPADWLTAKRLISLDGEDFDRVTIGSAGGLFNTASFPFTTVPAPAGYVFYQLALNGGLGGHSGSDIEKGRANTLKLLVECLSNTLDRHALVLSSLQGGQALNSIPNTATALVGVPSAKADEFTAAFDAYALSKQKVYATGDPGLRFTRQPVPAPREVVETSVANALLAFVNNVPNGVLQMSQQLPGMVETSSNLGELKTTATGFTLSVFMRSNSETALDAARDTLAAVFAMHATQKATMTPLSRFPIWEAKPGSPLLQQALAAFEQTCDIKALPCTMHFGLECSYFASRTPGMDIISIGPLVRDPHSTKERVKLSTLDDLWRVLRTLLENLGKENLDKENLGKG